MPQVQLQSKDASAAYNSCPFRPRARPGRQAAPFSALQAAWPPLRKALLHSWANDAPHRLSLRQARAPSALERRARYGAANQLLLVLKR